MTTSVSVESLHAVSMPNIFCGCGAVLHVKSTAFNSFCSHNKAEADASIIKNEIKFLKPKEGDSQGTFPPVLLCPVVL